MAVVTHDEEDGITRAFYLTTYPRLAKCSGYNATKVEDFGQRVEILNGRIRTVNNRESTATYKDGKPRCWQPTEYGEWWDLRMSDGSLKSMGVIVEDFRPQNIAMDLGGDDYTATFIVSDASTVFDLEDRIAKAIAVAMRYGGMDGNSFLAKVMGYGGKTWIIDQMVRHLSGDKYEELIREYKNGEKGPDTYTWDKGIAP
jgi:hypothetical protein